MQLKFITLIGKTWMTPIQRPCSVLPLVPMFLPRKSQVTWSWIASKDVGIPYSPRLTTVLPNAPGICVSWKFSARTNNREINPKVFIRTFNYRLCKPLRVIGFARSQKCSKNWISKFSTEHGGCIWSSSSLRRGNCSVIQRHYDAPCCLQYRNSFGSCWHL